MAASLSIPAPEPYATQTAVDPATSLTVAVKQDPLPLPMAPTSPNSSETSMLPLEILGDLTEIEEAAAEGQGAICAVTTTLKTYGRH